jgi:hypothetical protein
METPPQFIDVTMGIGFGAGIPIEFYAAAQQAWVPSKGE